MEKIKKPKQVVCVFSFKPGQSLARLMKWGVAPINNARIKWWGRGWEAQMKQSFQLLPKLNSERVCQICLSIM